MMNDRIKELRVEAVNYTNELKPLGLTMWELTCNQKFAELIVQDIITATLFKARWHQEMKDDTTVVALCELVDDIREEYGVEE
jgi:hypothetical protein